MTQNFEGHSADPAKCLEILQFVFAHEGGDHMKIIEVLYSCELGCGLAASRRRGNTQDRPTVPDFSTVHDPFELPPDGGGNSGLMKFKTYEIQV